MVYRIIGWKRVEYTSKKTGKQVSGYDLALGCEDGQFIGMAVDSQFVSSFICDRCGFSPIVGQDIELQFSKSRVGKGFDLTGIKVVES